MAPHPRAAVTMTTAIGEHIVQAGTKVWYTHLEYKQSNYSVWELMGALSHADKSCCTGLAAPTTLHGWIVAGRKTPCLPMSRRWDCLRIYSHTLRVCRAICDAIVFRS
jgi:hypothetical protein